MTAPGDLNLFETVELVTIPNTTEVFVGSRVGGRFEVKRPNV